MNVSVVVMAHPERAEWAHELAGALAAPVVWDRGRGPWDTARRALARCPAGADYHVVVQDDAVPCRDLLGVLPAALGHAAGRPVGLYVGDRPQGGRVAAVCRLAAGEGTPWIEAASWPLWGVGIAHPAGHTRGLVEFGDDYPAGGYSYDMRVLAYYRSVGLVPRFVCPSLLDHRPGESLLGHRDGRRAAVFVGADRSPVGVDWARPPLVWRM